MTTPRWKAQIAVEILGRNQTTVLLTDSVSEQGIFLRTDAPPPPMTLLRLEIRLAPDDTKLVVHGMVAHTVQPQRAHGVPGVEVAFFAMSGEALHAWAQFIKHLRAAHPDASYRPVALARELDGVLGSHAFVDEIDASDISPKGMFLATRQRFAVGTDVRVTLIDSQSSAQRSISGVVRRRVTGEEAGVGIEYCNMTRDAWADLDVLLRNAGPCALRAEVHVVRAPSVPLMMNTLEGPCTPDGRASIHAPRREDSWSLPPEDGWS